MSIDYTFTVTIATESAEQARRVMAERLNHDEDYGFDYTVSWADWVSAVPSLKPPQVIVKYDGNYRVVGLQCPKCSKTDIREYDRAERWNTIEIVNDGLAVSQGQADFETVNLICADCHTELGAPTEIFERMSWS